MLSISVVIPIYNEEDVIKQNISKVIDYFKKSGFDYELILVDDGSTDNSWIIINQFKDGKIKILENDINRGKGYTVKKGILESSKECILFMDADLSAPLDEIHKLLSYTSQYDIVIASRAVAGSKQQNKPLYQKILGISGNLLIRLFAVKGVHDTQCGFKLFNSKCKRIFEQQTIDRWGFDIEVLFLAQKMGYNIKEVPIFWNHSLNTRVKKIDYIKTLFELYKIKKNWKQGIYKI